MSSSIAFYYRPLNCRADFLQVLKLDPANAAARQELQKVQDALKAIPTKPKQVRQYK